MYQMKKTGYLSPCNSPQTGYQMLLGVGKNQYENILKKRRFLPVGGFNLKDQGK